jgi:hypothetical protein
MPRRSVWHPCRANAICERCLGSLRRECLDHILILGERHLCQKVQEYVHYFVHARPDQGIAQHIPCQLERADELPSGRIISQSVLGGLHHDYRRRAA